MALVEHPINELSARVIASAIEVHRVLGPGLLESSYHGCLCREFELRGIAYQEQVALPLDYKGFRLTRGYFIDLLVEDRLVVELKATEQLLPVHSAQVLTYMRLRKVSAGLLLNFNVTALVRGVRRILI